MDIEETWKSNKLNLKIPNIKLLRSGGSNFIVADDSSSIIFVISKTKHVYAIAKSKTQETTTEEGYPIYFAPNIDSVKVISCTIKREAKDANQRFAIENVLKFI
jgi:hypothetical protein